MTTTVFEFPGHESHEPSPPRTWRRVKLLGRGSYGEVHLAESENPKNARETEQIAVKTARPRHASSLVKEHRIYKALENCPEIARCYSAEVGLDEGRTGDRIIFLEYASAGTLESLIRSSGTEGLPEKDVRAFSRMILKGLDCMHESGYVHCDVKPSNVLAFVDDGDGSYSLKLADFGVSLEPRKNAAKKKFTRGKIFRGTAIFMSPESVTEGVIAPALDIWSLGCVVVCMVTAKSSPRHGLLGESKFDKTEFKGLLKSRRATPMVPEKLSEKGKDFLGKCFDRNHRTRWSAKMLLHHPFVSVD